MYIHTHGENAIGKVQEREGIKDGSGSEGGGGEEEGCAECTRQTRCLFMEVIFRGRCCCEDAVVSDLRASGCWRRRDAESVKN